MQFLAPTILASLVTEDPFLLVGRSGIVKAFLLNTLAEALGLVHRLRVSRRGARGKGP